MITIFALIFFLHLKQKAKLKSQENVCKNHNNCNAKMHGAYNKILKLNQEQRYINISFIIYAETESLLEKIYTCNNAHIVSTKLFTS